MKSLLLAGAMIVATGTCALAQGGYWVVGNRATSKCEIVTSNPVVNAQVGGNIWFGTGPYQSLDDAKLARSTIRGCPAVEEPPAETPDNEKNPIRSVFGPFRVRNASTQKGSSARRCCRGPFRRDLRPRKTAPIPLQAAR